MTTNASVRNFMTTSRSFNLGTQSVFSHLERKEAARCKNPITRYDIWEVLNRIMNKLQKLMFSFRKGT